MGIFSKANQSAPYVPRPTEGASTLLGDSAQPAAGLNDDLNKSPATTVDLHFAPVLSASGGSYHGYIVVTDNASGTQWTNEGGPDGARMSGLLPGGHLEASTTKHGPGVGPGSRQAASFTTDAPADQVADRLTNFAQNFTAKKLPYNLPYVGPVDPLGLVMRITQ